MVNSEFTASSTQFLLVRDSLSVQSYQVKAREFRKMMNSTKYSNHFQSTNQIIHCLIRDSELKQQMEFLAQDFTVPWKLKSTVVFRSFNSLAPWRLSSGFERIMSLDLFLTINSGNTSGNQNCPSSGPTPFSQSQINSSKYSTFTSYYY
ncbi:hypothetical protein FGO68_gene1410 [Halteria grandinella]|uniref:Uncharacterized protein n=1 Tax=Halteria grandinella TaxID=5974 RepID=A0A8J8TAZ8_HALGN|nr:hypothetical protein FGO68_gene1410 [Halteria grandinella]